MRRRLERFLPIVVLALVMQILAPIAASWAAGITVADPLQSASICHSDGTPDGPCRATHSPSCKSNDTEMCRRLSPLTVSMRQGLGCRRSATRLAISVGASPG